MSWTTNTTTMLERSRGASPQPQHSELSIDAGLDLENKQRVHTVQQLIVLGLDAWLKKMTT